MTTKTQRYLFETGPECKQRITRAYPLEVASFTHLVDLLRTTLAEFVYSKASEQAPPAHSIAFGIMLKSANTLMAGFELCLSGYHWEPPILFRSALEGCAAAWDIVNNEKSLRLWQSDKSFKSCDSITQLSKLDPFYGKWWGIQSNFNVHTSQANGNPTFFYTPDGQTEFQMYGFVPEGKEESRRYVIEASIVSALACLHLAEWVFHEYLSEPAETVVVGRDGKIYKRVTEEHERHIAAFHQTCALLSNGFEPMR